MEIIGLCSLCVSYVSNSIKLSCTTSNPKNIMLGEKLNNCALAQKERKNVISRSKDKLAELYNNMLRDTIVILKRKVPINFVFEKRGF